MNKYIITSDRFSGKIELGYDKDTGLLTYLNANCFVGSSNIKSVVIHQIPFFEKRITGPEVWSSFHYQKVEE